MRQTKNGVTISPSPIVGGYGKSNIDLICPDRTINQYPVFRENYKNQGVLFPFPGIKNNFGTVGFGPVRSALVVEGVSPKAFVVSGQAFYYLDSSITPVPLSGNIITTPNGFVSAAGIQTSVGFCDGVNAFYYNGVNVVPMTTIPGGVVPGHIASFDNYLIICDANSNKFYVSQFNSADSFSALRFDSLTYQPTLAVASISLKNRLFVFGIQFTQVYINFGGTSFPFRRDKNVLIEHGLESKGSLIEGFDRVFYLSRNKDGVGPVMMITGVDPQPISTPEIDFKIQKLTVTSDATGSVYIINGMIFYQLNFTESNVTLVYNVTTNFWHELMMINDDRFIAENHIFYLEMHLLFSFNSNKIYQMSEDFYSYDNELIKRQRIYRALASSTFESIIILRYEVDLLHGTGISAPGETVYEIVPTDPLRNPLLNLEVSEDGGITYKDYGGREIGTIGKRVTRTIWDGIGLRRDNIFKVTHISNLPYYCLGASIRYMINEQ